MKMGDPRVHLRDWLTCGYVGCRDSSKTKHATNHDIPGFWESLGYHNHADPWLEQRYWGD